MPLLAGFLGALFGALAEFFVKFFAKKTALGAAAISTFGILTVALFTTISALGAALNLATPAVPGLSSALWLVIPDNFAACMAIAISVDTACALYNWNVGNLKLAVTVT